MEVGERYIIEISDVIATNNGNLAKIKGFNALVFDENGLDKLDKIESNVRLIPPAALEQIKAKERQAGYEQGFKDGVKHQESMMPPKAEPNEPKPHEPQIGDIYKMIDGTKAIIFSMDKFSDNYYFKDADALKGIFGYKHIMEHIEFIENRKDLIDTLKGVLA